MASRILIAEDDPAVSRLVALTLEAEGHDVCAVASGAAVPDAIESFRPDLIVLDVMMPGRDGFAVLRDLRTDEQTATLPVILLTAKADTESTWEGWRTGCDYYMPKPFDPGQLAQVIERLIDAARTGVSA